MYEAIVQLAVCRKWEGEGGRRKEEEMKTWSNGYSFNMSA